MSFRFRILSHAAVQRSIVAGARKASRNSVLTTPHSSPIFFNTGRYPSNISRLAILIHRHALSTETAVSSGSAGNIPPPGFNAEMAKKPLPKEQPSKPTTPTPVKAQSGASPEEVIPRDVPTAVAKPNAVDDASITNMIAEKYSESTAKDQAAESKKEEKKLTLTQKIKKEVMHYWDGTKLLAAEIKISTKLALKMAAGYELSRREQRQLQRTVQDLARLVPFSVFVIVPFAEFLLPVALKLFPNLLPSTYEGQKAKDAKAKSLRNTRKEVSNLLRNTLRETGLPVSPANAQKEEFTEFFRKVRATGESPTPADVIKVCKIFKDDLTLDNLSRPQLVGMARYMNLNTFGTDAMLRYQIRHLLRQIKRDDKAISYEGVDSLSVPELQTACASRGIRTHGVSPGRLRDDLQMWLDLRLKYGVPSTLLVLSNAFMYAQGKDKEMSSQIDALTGVLSSIPEELFHEMELEVHNAEGAATNKQRLEVLREQQDLIEEENEQSVGQSRTGRETPKDDKNIDEKEEVRRAVAEAEAEVQAEKDRQAQVQAQTQAQAGQEQTSQEAVPESGDAVEVKAGAGIEAKK